MSSTMDEIKPATSHEVSPASEVAQDDAAVRPKVHFSLLGAIGLQYSVTSAPIAIGAYLSLAIGLGGSPAYFWGFFAVALLQLASCLAAAELASAIPHSSGPAYWAVVLASPKYARDVGYVMGWLTNAGWFFICAASTLYPAQMIMGLVEVAYPDFSPQPWHTYLVFAAFSLLYLLINLPYVFKTVNWLLVASVFAVNGTAIYLFVALLARAYPKQSAHAVFIDFVNASGWSSDGIVFFLALLPAVGALGAFDNATHLTDELEEPGKQVPQVILGSYVMSCCTALPMIVVYQFCNVDPESLLAAPGGQPLIALTMNAFQSFPMMVVAISMVVFCMFVAGCGSLVSWSRLYWSFSKHGALPFSGTMSKLSSRDALPLNALCWNTFMVLAIGTISMGSTTAMNALLGGASLCLLWAFVIVFGLLLHRGRKTLDPERWFNLGRWGDALLWVAVVTSVFFSVILCLPLYLPVTAETMNWSSAVFLGVIALSFVYWIAVFRKRERSEVVELL